VVGGRRSRRDAEAAAARGEVCARMTAFDVALADGTVVQDTSTPSSRLPADWTSRRSRSWPSMLTGWWSRRRRGRRFAIPRRRTCSGRGSCPSLLPYCRSVWSAGVTSLVGSVTPGRADRNTMLSDSCCTTWCTKWLVLRMFPDRRTVWSTLDGTIHHDGPTADRRPARCHVPRPIDRVRRSPATAAEVGAALELALAETNYRAPP
jgi:hypothetical protein